MNPKLEQSINRLKDEFKAAESALADTRDHLAVAVQGQLDDLDTRWKAAVAQIETKRGQVGEAGHRFVQLLEAKKHELVTKFEDWKTDREIDKLERTADRKEQEAVDAVLLAAYAILHADAAILDAIKARKIAVECAG